MTHKYYTKSDLPATKTEVLYNSPSTGITTIYEFYRDPSCQSSELINGVIFKTVITSVVGTSDVIDRYVAQTAGTSDSLSFNKTYAGRASYSYVIFNS
jgi:hypothetical protein